MDTKVMYLLPILLSFSSCLSGDDSSSDLGTTVTVDDMDIPAFYNRCNTADCTQVGGGYEVLATSGGSGTYVSTLVLDKSVACSDLEDINDTAIYADIVARGTNPRSDCFLNSVDPAPECNLLTYGKGGGYDWRDKSGAVISKIIKGTYTVIIVAGDEEWNTSGRARYEKNWTADVNTTVCCAENVSVTGTSNVYINIGDSSCTDL